MCVAYCSQVLMYKSKTIVINFKHVCNVRIFKYGERNHRSEFMIFFTIVVSKVWRYFVYILIHEVIWEHS